MALKKKQYRHVVKSDFHTMNSDFLLNGLFACKRDFIECLDHTHNPDYKKDLFELNLIKNDVLDAIERGMSYSRFETMVESVFTKAYSKKCKTTLDKYRFDKEGIWFDFLLFDGNVYQMTFLFGWGNDSITIYPNY